MAKPAAAAGHQPLWARKIRITCTAVQAGFPRFSAAAGLRDLGGVWGTREATSMKAVPRRLLVLGGGYAGTEIAQIVRRLGGEAVVTEGAGRVLTRVLSVWRPWPGGVPDQTAVGLLEY